MTSAMRRMPRLAVPWPVSSAASLKRDEIRKNRHRALAYWLSMIFSENRRTLFRIMLQKRSGDRAGISELLNGGLVIAGLAQDLVGMLADAGRLARLYLSRAVDEDRAVDGQYRIVLEGHQHLVLDHLLVMRDVVEDADHAEHETVAVENPAPFGEIPGGEYLVENPDQLQRARMASGLGGKALVRDEILAAHAARERRPLPFLVQKRENDPAAVPASVVIGHR